MGEDGGKDFGGGDGTGYGGEMVDGFAKVLCDEVGGEAGVEAGEDGTQRLGGGGEGLSVACVGYEDVVFGTDVHKCVEHAHYLSAQILETLAGEGGNCYGGGAGDRN